MYREKEASIMREHIPQSALQGVSCSYRCFWFRYYSDPKVARLRQALRRAEELTMDVAAAIEEMAEGAVSE